MFKDHTSRNKIFGFIVFLTSFVLYIMTLAPTASFWDAGEFIAVANGLQVTHPPGAPFYLLLGRLFSMFMHPLYVAWSINLISALASALTVMFLYLIIIRLIRQWKGNPDEYSSGDLISLYGGAVIGALTFAVTDTFWFSAVEAEVYALSMFFTAIVVWMAFKWSEHEGEADNDKWLILITYMFGLAIGVHLLNLLAIFFVALIIYFKKYDFEWKSFLIMAVSSVAVFLSIYPFTITTLPGMIETTREATFGLVGPLAFFLIIGAALAAAIYYTHQKNHYLANLILVGYAVILIGYSSYSLVFIRSIADPPIDENDPETVEAFVSYLKREQYGQTPLLTGHTYDNAKGSIDREEEVLFPRRYSSQGRHVQKYSEYPSDLSFFLSYQVTHMYLRYFNWNFIGRDSDIQDAAWQGGFVETQNEDNPAHNSYFYIPFLVGIFGFLYHFQSDWKRAFSVFVLFFMTGLAIVIFLNQTPYQPRERDYAYVGSFFAFSIWIGIGATGLVDYLCAFTKNNNIASFALLAALMFALPVWMGSENYHDHDRSERYVASDYAHNLLESTAPNALIFTNGDNDTFPLWYAQEVESVRTDVRVVCLSLLNTDWYIKQLRDQWSHESAPLPISISNEELEELENKFQFRKRSDFWEPKEVTIPVDKSVLKQAYSSKENYRNAIEANKTFEDYTFFKKTATYKIPIDSLDNEVSFYYEGNFLTQDREGNKLYYTRIQDDLIMDILKTNRWVRPVYFANTVSQSSQLNLQPYFRMEGQAFRVIPKKADDVSFYGYGTLDRSIHANRLKRFRYREMDNPDAYFDENIRRMLDNYRYSFTQLASKYQAVNKPDSALYWLRFGEDKIPFSTVKTDARSVFQYAKRYLDTGAPKEALRLAETARENTIEELKYQVNQVTSLENAIYDIDAQAQSARQNSDLEEARSLKSQINRKLSQREGISRNLSVNVLLLMRLQQIYFESGENDKAVALSTQVNQIVGDRFDFPTTKEQNQKRINNAYPN